ncbi:MAG: MBOAT family O-acyltransferase [Christensenellales bacterium]|jgi:alginate O-acetyltransferase complex protein AlgI
MLFSSISFLFLYLPAVLAGNALLPLRMRLPFLFAASLLFYGWGEPGTVILMVISILTNHALTLAMSSYPRRKKALLALSIGLQLAILGYFKYAGLIVPGFQVALPVGISFYTFQAIGYTIDVYRQDIPADRSLLRYGTFITLFPQLIAGPIERYGDIQPQLTKPALSWQNFARGTRLFVIGLSKKLLLANAAGQLWEALKDSPVQNGFLGNWVALVAFSFQIYFDFSGYSDMARGLGWMLGIRFMENFRYPYTARSITDFWRRWHISLSGWFRDYVYIPLGGNRRGLTRQIVNILIVWGLTGLWHGASWNFVIWGFYYAGILIAEKLFLLTLYARLPKGLAWLSRLPTLTLVLAGWVLFAFTDFAVIRTFLTHLVSGSPLSPVSWGLIKAFLPLFAVCTLASIPWRFRLPRLAEDLLLCALFLMCVAALVSQGYNPFLYFRF